MLQSVHMGVAPNVEMTEKGYIGWILKLRKQEKERSHPATIKALHISSFVHTF